MQPFNLFFHRKLIFTIFSLLTTLALLFILLPSLQRTFPHIENDQKIEQVKPAVRFEKNLGQMNQQIDFFARCGQYQLFINATSAILQFSSAENKTCADGYLQMTLPRANTEIHGMGLLRLASVSNYYIGNNADWRTGVPHFAQVVYQDVYPGIDLLYRAQKHIEFDFLLSPGADADMIQLAFNQADKIELDSLGDLFVQCGDHLVRFLAPRAFQEINGLIKTVAVRYILRSDKIVQLALGSYNHAEKLVIDPQVVYASYLGGSKDEYGQSIAVDESGCVYVAGITYSTDFPTRNAWQGGLYPDSKYPDIFITKMNPDGNDIIYSTYLGGKYDESPEAIAVDRLGRACITGRVTAGYGSEGFPLKNALRSKTNDSQNGYVAVLDAAGGLYYSTLLGGKYEDYGRDIAVDLYGCVYVTGAAFSFDFPIKNAFMSQKPSYYFDAFVTKLDPAKSGEESLIYSTFLGGDTEDYGASIAVDRHGCAYVTGQTLSSDYPTTANAIQKGRQGKGDIFVTKLSADGSTLVYSTILGNELANSSYAIEVDNSGCAFVSGSCALPATPGAFASNGIQFIGKLNGFGSGFDYLARLYAAGKLALDEDGNVYSTSTYLNPGKGGGILALKAGGSDTVFTYPMFKTPRDIAWHNQGAVVTVSYTDSAGLATANALQAAPAGKNDAFIAKIKVRDQKDELVVKVNGDPLFNDEIIPNTRFDIYAIDLSNRAAPLTFLESRSTDGKGLLHLPDELYDPAMPIFIRTVPHLEPSVKNYRTRKTAHAYEIYLDNLIIDKEGRVSAQLLEPDSRDTTQTYLSHASVAFNFVVSIEWLASADYVDKLVAAFRKANNLLYDISNGQAWIDTVAIFDNGDHWQDADLRIRAENTQWPCANVDGINQANDACISFPPVWYGTPEQGILRLYNAEPINPFAPLTISSFVHELGHYAMAFWDEYRDRDGNNKYPPPADSTYNFGFMDDPYSWDQPMSTEMSDYLQTDAVFPVYTRIHQYQSNHGNCWDWFQNLYSDDLWVTPVRMRTPKDLAVPSNTVIKGPNSDLENPDFSVGDMMGFELLATTTPNPRRDFMILNSLTRQPAPGASVKLIKQATAREIVHGKTTATGRIKLFNAEPGDNIHAAFTNGSDYLFNQTVVNPALFKTGDGSQTIELKQVSGKFTLVSDISFDAAGQPVYHCQADPAFLSAPAIRVNDGVSLSAKQALTPSGKNYSALLNKSDFDDASIYFTAPDSLAAEFFVAQEASLVNLNELGHVYVNSSMQLQFDINRSAATAQKFALLASVFPAPAKGLPDSMRRVSDVIAVKVYPEGSLLLGRMHIHYFPDSLQAEEPSAVKLYQWQNGWIPLNTAVDLDRYTVSTNLVEPGIYAAFLDLTRSKITRVSGEGKPVAPTGWLLRPNYPNPFNPCTRIQYHAPFQAHVRIEIFNLLGQRVRTLVDRFIEPGVHSVSWDGCDDLGQSATAGIYFYRLVSGAIELTGKMTLIR